MALPETERFEVNDCIWCNSDACTMSPYCIHVTSPIKETSLQQCSRRSLANVLLEDLSACAPDLSGHKDPWRNALDKIIENGGGSGSKVFPEDIFDIHFKNGQHAVKEYLEQATVAVPWKEKLDLLKNSVPFREELKDVRGSLASAGGAQDVGVGLEERSEQFGVITDNMALETEPHIDVLIPDDFGLLGKLDRGNLLQEEGFDKRFIDVDAYSLGHEKETDVELAEATPEAGHLCLERENDVEKLREALNAVWLELEQERKHSEIAANEAMAMISRIQKEKSSSEMEARQFQRIAEEKAAHDREAIAVLKDVLMKRVIEIEALEKEVELYRQKLLGYKIEQWERSKTEMGSDMVALALEGEKELVCLLGGTEEWKSSLRGETRDPLLTSVGTPALDAIVGMDCPMETQRSLWPDDRRNLRNSFHSVHVDGPALFKQDESEDDTESRNLVSKPHSCVGEICEETVQEDSASNYIFQPKIITSSKYNQGKVYDESDQCSTDYHIQQVRGTLQTVGAKGNATEDKEPRSGEERWQFVLEQLCNLKKQIQQLRGREKIESNNSLTDPCKSGQGKTTCKLLKIDKFQFANSRRKKMLGCSRCDHCFDTEERPLSDKKNVKKDRAARNTVSRKKLYADLCKGLCEKGCTQSKKLNTACHSFKSEQIGSHSIGCPKVDGLWCNGICCGNSNHIVGTKQSETETEITEKWSTSATIDGIKVSCSMPKLQNSLIHETRTAEDGNIQDSLNFLDELLPAVSLTDSCTLQMLRRGTFKTVIEHDLQKLTSRFQALEADWKLMRQTIANAMEQERKNMELLIEHTQQLRELHSFKSEEYRQQQIVPSVSSSKGGFSVTGLGNNVLALLNNLANLLSGGVITAEHEDSTSLCIPHFETLAKSNLITSVSESGDADLLYQEDPSGVLSSTIFDWLLDERGRSGTALNGWD